LTRGSDSPFTGGLSGAAVGPADRPHRSPRGSSSRHRRRSHPAAARGRSREVARARALQTERYAAAGRPHIRSNAAAMHLTARGYHRAAGRPQADGSRRRREGRPRASGRGSVLSGAGRRDAARGVRRMHGPIRQNTTNKRFFRGRRIADSITPGRPRCDRLPRRPAAVYSAIV
jgi:hypothetical protein